LIGTLGAGVFWLASAIWPTAVAIILSLGATVLITGALHEDGLADAADGFGGGQTPERILEIMKDSRIGTYGAMALILVLLLKLSALASLTRADTVTALIAAHTLSRWSSVALMWRYAYLGTKGAAFGGKVTLFRALTATVIAAAICAAVLRWRAVNAILVAIVVTAAAGMYFRRRLGGVTGDCLGAANQLVEVAIYLTLFVA
jgi:adenosylcobinamide-GDP ribazoletransferase